MQRRTIIVDGPLAFRMRRVAAARAGKIGLDILTLPLLAARLAGGFVRPADGADIEQAVRTALDLGGFERIERACDLPGFVRAAARSLAEIWEEGLTLRGQTPANAQAADMALLEERVRATLPTGVLDPIELSVAALARVGHARAVFGAIELDQVAHVAPAWRGLLEALRHETDLCWRAPPSPAPDWFSGRIIEWDQGAAVAPEYMLCANHRAEAVEALRWLRALLADGVPPSEIALTAATTEPWDDHLYALARDGGLPLYFAHGLPALATHAGQACAALADLMLRGLNQDRFRRLASYAAGHSKLLAALPRDWRKGLAGQARLADAKAWRAALNAARAAGYPNLSDVLMPAITLLARGKDGAAEAGAALLPPEAQQVWTGALHRAPVDAIEQALKEMRFADDRDPSACAVWGGALVVVGAPRRHTRLIGLASRRWPRRGQEDALLPQHVFPRDASAGHAIAERDRAAFAHIVSRATGSCIISRSRRDAQGGRQAPSPLLSHVAPDTWVRLRRDRRAEHAFNETDRLLARPEERRQQPLIASASACLANRRKSALTPHDGVLPDNHALIEHTLRQPQSATSLQTVLRDPLGYVWRYVLGWEPPREIAEGTGLDPRVYGELLHDLLRRVVQDLGATFARASSEDVAHAVDKATAALAQHWPLTRSTPPPLLWRHTLELAAAEARGALRQAVGEGTESWAEIRFGRETEDGATSLPWPPTAQVVLDKSGLKIAGAIDRLDRRPNRDCRVTDYKTGNFVPPVEFEILGGREVQRVLYTLAVRQLLPDTAHVTAVLLYLHGDQSARRSVEDMDPAPFLDAVLLAINVLREGRTVAGEDAFARFNDFALALPAASENYKPRKDAALRRALHDLRPIWEMA